MVANVPDCEHIAVSVPFKQKAKLKCLCQPGYSIANGTKCTSKFYIVFSHLMGNKPLYFEKFSHFDMVTFMVVFQYLC